MDPSITRHVVKAGQARVVAREPHIEGKIRALDGLIVHLERQDVFAVIEEGEMLRGIEQLRLARFV